MSELAIPTTDPSIALTETTLTVIDPNTSLEEIGVRIKQAVKLGDTARWWIGDLYRYAEDKWGEGKASQLTEMARLSERQFRRYTSVARLIEPARRRANLSFSHHEEITSLDPTVGDRLLAIADDQELSIERLREMVRDQKAIMAPPPARIVMKADTAAVDAARGLRAARETLRTVGSTSSEVSETLNIGGAIRGLDAAAKIVRRNDPLEEVLDAVGQVIGAAVVQSGLADPAAIVPSGVWANLVAAHDRATEGRSK